MSTHNIGFYGDLTRIIFELSSEISSNTHLISSAVRGYTTSVFFCFDCQFGVSPVNYSDSDSEMVWGPYTNRDMWAILRVRCTPGKQSLVAIFGQGHVLGT